MRFSLHQGTAASSETIAGWVLLMIMSVMVSLALALILVWFNIERLDMAYELKRLRAEENSRSALTAKLEVERDRFLSPYILGQKAEALGMRDALPGQVRSISIQRENVGDDSLSRALEQLATTNATTPLAP